MINIVTGERYKTITNEVKRYLQGVSGKASADVNAKLCAQAIGNEIVIEDCPADLLNPEMDKLSKDIELDIINLNGYGRIEPVNKTVLANT